MQGPISIDPSRLAAAKKAYNDDLAANVPQLVDDQGRSRAVSPFVTDADGNTTFNRWIDSENRNSAQNHFFDDTDTDADGNTTTVRRPAWQAFSDYTNDEARGQFDFISAALKALQGRGFKRMNRLYSQAIGKVS